MDYLGMENLENGHAEYGINIRFINKQNMHANNQLVKNEKWSLNESVTLYFTVFTVLCLFQKH